MNIVSKAIIGSLMAFMFVFVVNFTIVNIILGCETWDKNLWTEYNSCIMPMEFVQMINPLK